MNAQCLAHTSCNAPSPRTYLVMLHHLDDFVVVHTWAVLIGGQCRFDINMTSMLREYLRGFLMRIQMQGMLRCTHVDLYLTFVRLFPCTRSLESLKKRMQVTKRLSRTFINNVSRLFSCISTVAYTMIKTKLLLGGTIWISASTLSARKLSMAIAARELRPTARHSPTLEYSSPSYDKPLIVHWTGYKMMYLADRYVSIYLQDLSLTNFTQPQVLHVHFRMFGMWVGVTGCCS